MKNQTYFRCDVCGETDDIPFECCEGPAERIEWEPDFDDGYRPPGPREIALMARGMQIEKGWL